MDSANSSSVPESEQQRQHSEDIMETAIPIESIADVAWSPLLDGRVILLPSTHQHDVAQDTPVVARRLLFSWLILATTIQVLATIFLFLAIPAGLHCQFTISNGAVFVVVAGLVNLFAFVIFLCTVKTWDCYRRQEFEQAWTCTLPAILILIVVPISLLIFTDWGDLIEEYRYMVVLDEAGLACLFASTMLGSYPEKRYWSQFRDQVVAGSRELQQPCPRQAMIEEEVSEVQCS